MSAAAAATALDAAEKVKDKVKPKNKEKPDEEKPEPRERRPRKKSGPSPSEKVYSAGSKGILNQPRYWEPKSVAGYRRVLTAEFVLCMLLVVGKAFLEVRKGNQPFDRKFAMKLFGIWIVFLILGLVSSVSWKVARIAAAFGGLVTLTLLIGQESVVTNILSNAAGKIKASVNGPAVTGNVTNQDTASPAQAAAPSTLQTAESTFETYSLSPVVAIYQGMQRIWDTITGWYGG